MPVPGRILAASMAATLLVAAVPKGFVIAERLTAPSLPGFKVAFTAKNTVQSITEEVPKGETVEVWTQMITTQRFARLAQQTTPADYLRTIAEGLAQNCRGGRASPIDTVTISGRPAARMRATCPLVPQTGKPETFFIVAIAGRNDMHVKQIAFRRIPSAADEVFVAEFLAGVDFCPAGSQKVGC